MANWQQPVQAPNMRRVPTAPSTAGGEVVSGLKGLKQPLYDSNSADFAAAATPIRAQFFALGQTGGRSWEDTNVPTAGKLPGGQTFSVRGLAIKLSPNNTGTPNSLDFFNLSRGLCTLSIGDRQVFREYVRNLGGFGGFSGVGQGANVVPFLNTSSSAVRDHWVFDHPKYSLPINAEQSFRVTLSWRGGLPTALTTNWIVEVHLLGILVGFIDRL